MPTPAYGYRCSQILFSRESKLNRGTLRNYHASKDVLKYQMMEVSQGVLFNMISSLSKMS